MCFNQICYFVWVFAKWFDSKLVFQKDLEIKCISFAKVLKNVFHTFSVCGDQEDMIPLEMLSTSPRLRSRNQNVEKSWQ